jgi:HD-like signal output (HDOD) protein
MVSVGICTRLIAIRQGLQNFEDAYLAGLMHDFGIIMEDQQIHEPFKAMIRSLDDHHSLAEAERACLGFDHAILGSRIAEAWKFPPTVRAAIRFHHHSDKYHGEGAKIVGCVEVANFLCSSKGISSVGINLVTLSREVVAALSYTREDLEILMTDLDHEMERYTDLFAV